MRGYEPNKRLFVDVGVPFDVRVVGELQRACLKIDGDELEQDAINEPRVDPTLNNSTASSHGDGMKPEQKSISGIVTGSPRG